MRCDPTQVKASEVVVSDAYKVGLTLRFPRVESIRTDRAWYQTTTLSEVRTLRDTASGKLATRHYIASRKHQQLPFKSLPSIRIAEYRLESTKNCEQRFNISNNKISNKSKEFFFKRTKNMK